MDRVYRPFVSALRFIILVICSACWFAPSVLSQGQPYFLEIEPFSRNRAMGYAGVALTGGENTAFWNPAASSQARSFGVTATRFSPIWYSDDVVYEHIGGHFAPSRTATFGAALTYLNWGKIDYCGNDTPVCTNASYDLSVASSLGLRISDRVHAGSTIKLLYLNRWAPTHEPPPRRAVTRLALDIGCIVETKEFEAAGKTWRASFGANLANLGPRLQWRHIPYSGYQASFLPTYLRFGFSLNTLLDGARRITVAGDFKWPVVDRVPGRRYTEPLSDRRSMGLGAEYGVSKLVDLRAGFHSGEYLNSDRDVATLGAGLKYRVFRLDASYEIALTSDYRNNDGVRFSVAVAG